MNILIISFGLLPVSLFLGWVKYGSLAESYKSAPWQLKFIEIWNCFINFFITSLIGYYFVAIRWPLLDQGQNLNTGDFTLLILLILGIFGHLVVMSKNITEGINAVLEKVLAR